MTRPTDAASADRKREAREHSGILEIGRRMFRAVGIRVSHAARISIWAAILASFLLASCELSSYKVESAVLTPGNSECAVTDYESLLRRHLSSLAVEGSRSPVLDVLSKMATKIWRMKSKPEETCRVRFTIVNPDPLRPFGRPIFYFAVVTFIVDVDKICLNHNDSRHHAYD